MTGNTNVPHITAQDVTAGIHKLAQERPGVYERQDGVSGGCVNVEFVGVDRVPSCIVGSYLATVVGLRNVPTSGAVRGVLSTLTEQGLMTIDPMAAFLLATAQALQDTRKVRWDTISDTIEEIRYSASKLVEANLKEAKNETEA